MSIQNAPGQKSSPPEVGELRKDLEPPRLEVDALLGCSPTEALHEVAVGTPAGDERAGAIDGIEQPQV